MVGGQQVPDMNQTLDKGEALAICFRNLKGSKTKDLLLTARALQSLKRLPEFGSNQSVAEAVGVSGEVVRQFIGLLDLPEDIQAYLERGELGLEHGRRLLQIGRARPEVVERAAKLMTSMTAMQTRDLAEHVLRNPGSSIEESVDALQAAKQIVTREFHVDTVLDERAYLALTAQARKRKLRPTQMASTIIIDWLESNDDTFIR